MAKLTASGVDGGHDLHPRALQAKGVTLVGRFAGAEDGQLRFVDDLAESIAWGDARYGDFSRLVERLCTERGLEVPELPDPAPFVADPSPSVDARSIGTVIFSGGFRPDYSWVHVDRWVRSDGLPGTGRRSQHRRPRAVLRGRAFPAHPQVVAALWRG